MADRKQWPSWKRFEEVISEEEGIESPGMELDAELLRNIVDQKLDQIESELGAEPGPSYINPDWDINENS